MNAKFTPPLHVRSPRRRALDLVIAKRQPDLSRVFDHVKAGSNLLLLRLTRKWAWRHAEHSPSHDTLKVGLAFRLSQASFFLCMCTSQNCLPTKRPVITSMLRFDGRTWNPITIKDWTYWTFWTHPLKCPERVREASLLHPENKQLLLVHEISKWRSEICV